MGRTERYDGMTRKQRDALAALRLVYGRGEAYDYGVVTSSASFAMGSRQPWINWRTAYSLAARGLAVVTDLGSDGAEVRAVGPGGRA
jgi:hypothetical protein